MLWFERELVASMVAHLDHDEQRGVADFIAFSLREMPEHLRLGVAVESVALGAWARLPVVRRRRTADLRALESSPLNPVRQYARLMRSLARFAEEELRPGAGG